jgi:hypothetical protein
VTAAAEVTRISYALGSASNNDRIDRPSIGKMPSLNPVGRSAPALIDLMQLDHVAVWVVQEQLRGLGADGAGQGPVFCAALIQFRLGLSDVRHSERDMRHHRVLPWTLREGRRHGPADKVELSGLADIHPEAGDAPEVRPACVGSEAEETLVKVEVCSKILRSIIDTDGVMMDFDNSDWHIAPRDCVMGKTSERRRKSSHESRNQSVTYGAVFCGMVNDG